MKKPKQDIYLTFNDVPFTHSQCRAIYALSSRTGTAVFDNHGVAICAGVRLGFMRATWNGLRDLNVLTIDGRRMTLTELGQSIAKQLHFSNKEDVPIRDQYEDGDEDEETYHELDFNRKHP